MRSRFEKAYEPNPHKSPFIKVRFNEEKQIYEPLNPPLDRVARSLNAAWYGYRIRQTEVDELQKRVDQQGLIIAKVMSIASDLQKSWEMFEIGKKLEQALNGGEESKPSDKNKPA